MIHDTSPSQAALVSGVESLSQGLRGPSLFITMRGHLYHGKGGASLFITMRGSSLPWKSVSTLPEIFLQRDEWAAKNFLVKSHLNPIPPPAINNDRSLNPTEQPPRELQMYFLAEQNPRAVWSTPQEEDH